MVSTNVYTTYMPTAQITKWGNSLAIRIPKPLAERAGMSEGDPIELEARHGEITLQLREKVPTLKELVARITPENRHGETLASPEVGREFVEW